MTYTDRATATRYSHNAIHRIAPLNVPTRDEDGWTYVAEKVSRPHDAPQFIVSVYDADNHLLGYL
jgi:hypothetical protein